MLPQNISTDLSVYDDNALLNYATDLILRFRSSTVYPKPSPTVDEMDTVAHEFSDALSQSRTGGSGATARKNGVRKRLEAALLKWIAYATDETPGDTVAWLEAGFKLTKGTRDKVQPLPMPTVFTVDISGDAGTAKLHQNPQETSRAYVFGSAPVPPAGQDPVYTWYLCGKPDCLITGLESERPHLFVAGVWNGSQPWPNLSKPVRRVVQ